MPPKKPVMKAVHKPKADFKKLKRKVGKTVPLPQNQTRTTITAKSIAVPLQQLDEKNEPTNAHNQSLNDLLIMLVHYNSSIRRDAYMGMNDLFNRNPGLFAKEIARLIGRLGEGAVDPAPEVRNACCIVTYQHLGTISEGRMGPLMTIYMQYIVAAMSHVDTGIRADSSHFLRLLLVLYPTLVRRHCNQILPNFSSLLADRNIAASQAQSSSLGAFTSSSMSSAGTFLPSASINAAKMQRSTNSARKHQIKALGAAGLFTSSNGANEEDQVTSLLMRGASSANSSDLSGMQVTSLNTFTSVFNLGATTIHSTTQTSVEAQAQAISATLLNTSTVGMNHMHLSLSLLEAALRLHTPPAEAQHLEDILSEYMTATVDSNERSVWYKNKGNGTKAITKRSATTNSGTKNDPTNINVESDASDDSDSDSSDDSNSESETMQDSSNVISVSTEHGVKSLPNIQSKTGGIIFSGRSEGFGTQTSSQTQRIDPSLQQKPVTVSTSGRAMFKSLLVDPLSSILNSPLQPSDLGLGSVPTSTAVRAMVDKITSDKPQSHQSQSNASNTSKTPNIQNDPKKNNKPNNDPPSMLSGSFGGLPPKAGKNSSQLALPPKPTSSNDKGKEDSSKISRDAAHLLSGTRASVAANTRAELTNREHLFSISSITDDLVTALIDCWVENFPLEWMSQSDREHRGSDLNLSRYYDLHGISPATNNTPNNRSGAKSSGLNSNSKNGKGKNTAILSGKALSLSLSILGYVASCLLSLARCDIAVQKYKMDDASPGNKMKNSDKNYFDRENSTSLFTPLRAHMGKIMTHVLPYFPLSATATHDIRAVATINLSLAHIITLLISTTPSQMPPTPPRLAMKEYHDLTQKQHKKLKAKEEARFVAKAKAQGQMELMEDPRFAYMTRREWEDFKQHFEIVREFEQALLGYVMASYDHHRVQEHKTQMRLAARMESRERSLYGYDQLFEQQLKEEQEEKEQQKQQQKQQQRKRQNQFAFDDEDEDEDGNLTQSQAQSKKAKTHSSENAPVATSYLGVAPLPELLRTTWALLPHLATPVQTWLVDTFSLFYASCSVTPLSPAKLQCIPILAALLHSRGNGRHWFQLGFASTLWIPSLPQLLGSVLESCAAQKPLTANYTARTLATFPLRVVAGCISAIISYTTRVYRAPSAPVVAQSIPLSLIRRGENELRQMTNRLQSAVVSVLQTRRMNSDLGKVASTVLLSAKDGQNSLTSERSAVFDWDSLQGDMVVLLQNSVDCAIPMSASVALNAISPLFLSTMANAGIGKTNDQLVKLYQPGPIFSMLASEQMQRSLLHSSLYSTILSPALLSSLAFMCRYSSNPDVNPFEAEAGARNVTRRQRFGKESKLLPAALPVTLRLSLIELVGKCSSRIPTNLYLSFLISCCLASSDLTAHPAFSPAFHLDPHFLETAIAAKRERRQRHIQEQEGNSSLLPESILDFTDSPLVHMLFPLAQLSHPAVTAAVLSSLSNIVLKSDYVLKYISAHPENAKKITGANRLEGLAKQSQEKCIDSETKQSRSERMALEAKRYSAAVNQLVPTQAAQGEILLDMMSNLLSQQFIINVDALSQHYIRSLYSEYNESGVATNNCTASVLFGSPKTPTYSLAGSLPVSELPAFINIGRLSVILTHLLQLTQNQKQIDLNPMSDEVVHLPTLPVVLFRALARALAIWLPILCEAHVVSLPTTENILPLLTDIDFPAQPEAPTALLYLFKNVPGLLGAVVALWSNSILLMTKNGQSVFETASSTKSLTSAISVSIPTPSIISISSAILVISSQASLCEIIRNSEDAMQSQMPSLLNLMGMQPCSEECWYRPTILLPKMYHSLRTYSNQISAAGVTTSDAISADPVLAPVGEQLLQNLRSAMIVMVDMDPNLHA